MATKENCFNFLPLWIEKTPPCTKHLFLGNHTHFWMGLILQYSLKKSKENKQPTVGT